MQCQFKTKSGNVRHMERWWNGHWVVDRVPLSRLFMFKETKFLKYSFLILTIKKFYNHFTKLLSIGKMSIQSRLIFNSETFFASLWRSRALHNLPLHKLIQVWNINLPFMHFNVAFLAQMLWKYLNLANNTTILWTLTILWYVFFNRGFLDINS